MNQRLREFERASHIDVYGLGKNRDQWKSALENFAELIVAEAIAVVQKRFMGDLTREDMEVRRCVKDLKKYFGGEE